MSWDDLDVTSITTGLVAVLLVAIVGAIAILGHPIPEGLSLALASVISFLFGRGYAAPGTAAHVRALEANTLATQQVASTFDAAVPIVTGVASIASMDALARATDSNTAAHVSTAMREHKHVEEVKENTVALGDATNATEELAAQVAENTAAHQAGGG